MAASSILVPVSSSRDFVYAPGVPMELGPCWTGHCTRSEDGSGVLLIAV